MAMTVRQVIAALKKYPPNAPVCFAAHDNSPDEIQGQASCVIDLAPGRSFDDHSRGEDRVPVLRS